MELLKVFAIYWFVMFIVSILLVLFAKNNTTPIENTGALRIGGIIPIREATLLPPISFGLWYLASEVIGREDVPLWQLFAESLVAMFLTGFSMHLIFGVKSKLGATLGIMEEPDGTGIAPFSNF